MKHRIILMAALFISAAAFSQQTKLGVKLGTNIASWNVSASGSDLKTTSKAGLEAGLLADIFVSPSFSIQPEALFSMYGTKLNSGGTEIDYRVNYLNIPVLAKYHLPQGIAFYAGPQVGLLMSAKGKSEDEGKQDVKHFLKSTDVFAVIGAEYNMPMGVFVTIRYNHGLVNIYDQEEGNIKNSSFGISLGYKIKPRMKKR